MDDQYFNTSGCGPEYEVKSYTKDGGWVSRPVTEFTLAEYFSQALNQEEKSCEDSINHPSHYTQGKIEVIDFIEDQKMDFRAASALKYLCRYRFKGKPLEDLKKSVWYINRIIQELEKESGR
jgi:hypothetical protein